MKGRKHCTLAAGIEPGITSNINQHDAPLTRREYFGLDFDTLKEFLYFWFHRNMNCFRENSRSISVFNQPSAYRDNKFLFGSFDLQDLMPRFCQCLDIFDFDRVHSKLGLGKEFWKQ